MTSHPHKKHRPIRSCLSCRNRRVKCDQTHPVCGNCARTSRSCRYDYGEEEAYQHCSSRASPQTSPAAASTSSSHPRSIPELGHVHRTLGGRTRYVGPSFWGISNKEGPELDKYLGEASTSAPDFSTLCQGCSGLDLLGGSDIAAVRSLRRELSDYDELRTIGRLVERLPARKVCDQLWEVFINTIYPLIPVLHLPTFYAQYDSFWLAVQQLRRTGIASGLLSNTPTFICLIFSTLFCGSFHTCFLPVSPSKPPVEGSGHNGELSRQLYKATMQSLSFVGFPHDPTIYSLAAFVIWQIPLIREETERSTTFICTAFRVGQALGLHRDPEHFFGAAGGAEAEIRRRLWWHIVHKDTLSSTASGLPPMLWDKSQHDTLMPAESKESDEAHLAGFRDQPSSSEPFAGSNHAIDSESIASRPHYLDHSLLKPEASDCRHVVSIGRFLITGVIREILGKQAGIGRWTRADVEQMKAEIQRVSTQVAGRMDLLLGDEKDLALPDGPISSDLDLSSRQASIESWTLSPTCHNKTFLSWSRQMLGLMLEKAYCVLYQPLQKHPDVSLWARYRSSALLHFQDYIRHYMAMCTEPSFAPFQWMYPGNYQPLQAVAVLLTDLLENPGADEAETSRRLIDEVFSLLSDEGGVVVKVNGRLKHRMLPKAGRQAWAMLSELRRRAWKVMGIDPSVLWTDGERGTIGTRVVDSEPESTATETISPVMTDSQANAGSAPSTTLTSLSDPSEDVFATLMDQEFMDGLLPADSFSQGMFGWTTWTTG